MAFNALTSAEITGGKPWKQETCTKVKNNFDDHETRISDLEAALQTYPPMQFKVRGASSLYAPVTGIEHLRLFNNITLVSGRIFVFVAGASGTVEIDVQYKRGGASFTSIFSVRPSVAFGAGDYALSSNGVLSVTDLDAGDILRLDLVTSQTDLEEFDVYLPFNARV